MKLVEVKGFTLLMSGVAGVIAGIGLVARDMPLGWGIVAVGAVLTYGAYRLLRRPAPAEVTKAEPGAEA